MAARPRQIALHLGDLGGDTLGEVRHLERAYGNPSRRSAMCYPPGARPPDVPSDVLPPMSGGSGAEDLTLASADGTKFRAYLARAGACDAGAALPPDV